MGAYLNTGFDKFKESLNARIYVDKSELIDILNNNIKTPQKYICISRPRRFGKSVTANMLCAYYSKDTDSSFFYESTIRLKSSRHNKILASDARPKNPL